MFRHELIVKEQSLRHLVGREGRPSQDMCIEHQLLLAIDVVFQIHFFKVSVPQTHSEFSTGTPFTFLRNSNGTNFFYACYCNVVEYTSAKGEARISSSVVLIYHCKLRNNTSYLFLFAWLGYKLCILFFVYDPNLWQSRIYGTLHRSLVVFSV